MTTVFVARHGETDWNLAQRFQGHTDIDLNAAGERQAARLAERMRGETLAAVYASDLKRAYRTAQACASVHGLDVVREPDLRERSFGIFEGQTHTEIERRHPEAYQRWRARDPDFAVDRGESLRQVHARVVEFFSRLSARHPHGQVLVVTHGGVLDLIYRMAMQLPLEAPRTWATPNAALNQLQYRAGTWHLSVWADEDHL